jgi:hypothetical protein
MSLYVSICLGKSHRRCGRASISCIWSRKMSIAVRPARNLHTVLRAKNTDRSCTAIGPTPAGIARSKAAARQARSASLRAGSTRLDENPPAMGSRREIAEHPFGTMKMRMGATHFLMKTLPKVATEMTLCVLTYNLTRLNIQSDALEHRWCARATRSYQGIGAGTHLATPTEMGMRRPRIVRGPVQDALSAIFFQSASGARLGAPAGVHIPGSDIFTQPRPKPDVADLSFDHLVGAGEQRGWDNEWRFPKSRPSQGTRSRTLGYP